MMQPGSLNLITDVEGLFVGNADDTRVRSGVTVLTAETPFTAAVHVMGGAPGTRETDLLAPDKMVQEVDALVLSGGSALGLSAASGVADALRARGRGFDVAGQRVPIVPAAILFDLLNGGDKSWTENPYAEMGRHALDNAGVEFEIGSVGAGFGATTSGLMGGLGSASVVLPSGHIVGALVAVNAIGSATMGENANFWAAPWEMAEEFGGLGMAADIEPGAMPMTKGAAARESTTIGIVATDAAMTQAACQRMATAAHDGMARALVPSHTPHDGDLIFAAATGAKGEVDPLILGHAAASCLARAIARGVFHAKSGIFPSWQEQFG